LSLAGLNQPFVIGSLPTRAGLVPRISGRLTPADRRGTLKVRWGVGRMDYRVDPGLYAIGDPDEASPVLVTANYKLTFDKLRAAVVGHHFWMLVLDTKGVNVWCAAGKGTFSTEEIVRLVEASRLAEVVSHRVLIVPQLGAPGVAAHEVKRLCGFRIQYGPVQAQDVPAFVESGCSASAKMRRKEFPVWERIVLIPIELVSTFKFLLILIPAFFVLGGFWRTGNFWANATSHGFFAVCALLGAVFAGAVLTPVLLPWLPGRSFTGKGFIAGFVSMLLIAFLQSPDLTHWASRLEIIAWMLAGPAVAAYLAMNFTGASTYTSLSGVKREMRWAVPVETVAGATGIILWFGSLLAA